MDMWDYLDTHHSFEMPKKLVAYKWIWQQWQRLQGTHIETLESGIFLSTYAKKLELKTT